MYRSVRLCGRLMVAAGVLTLLITVGQWWLGNASAERAQSQTVRELEREFAAGSGHRIADAQPLARRDDAVMEHPLTARAALPAPASVSTLDGAYALIRIPRFGAGYIRPVVEGTDAQDLKEGVGHYRGTAAPGQRGNFAVAGHRTTYGEPFHLIAELRPGDRIIVRTRAHIFVYRVVSHQVVSPADVQVIAADPPGMRPGYLMTLTSCHPMYLASQRYVVHARLLSTT